ncbi:MAG: His/Gly/Thr/Pro-type tRNA ligase C-terminal domain-containing protein, partial [Pontibacterium sp.]
VCAGGRYDGLVAQLGGKTTPAVGFAMGVERLILMLETLGLIPESLSQQVDVYVTAMGDNAALEAMKIAENLRTVTDLRVQLHCGGGSFKSQMKKADKSGAAYAILIGDNELAESVVTIKPLRTDEEQMQVGIDMLPETLQRITSDNK